MRKLRVDIWSDVACPWCYVGKRRFEQAVAGFAHADAVEVVWRSFELDPGAPARHDASSTYAGRLAAKYRRTPAQAQDMLASMTATAAGEGIAMRFDQVQAGNTFDAHRVIHLAAAHGKQDAMKERLLRAYFSDGRAIGDRDTLVELAIEVGLDGDAVRAALASDAESAAVRADEGLARELGISGVPFFVVDGKFGVSGAQPAEALAQVLERAWREGPATAPDDEAAPACGPDGCA